MRSWITGFIVVILLGGGGYYWFASRNAGMPGDREGVGFRTPPGVTLQTLGDPREKDGTFGAALAVFYLAGTAYADANGMTLYTYDKDVAPGQSACADDCAKAWPPAIAPTDAKPSGDWSLVARADGSKQWALRSKPLYTSSKDAQIGDSKGDGADGVWHVAQLTPPGKEAQLPYDIIAQDAADAGGVVLADRGGMTLYAFDGNADHDRPACSAGPCVSHWKPLATGEIVNPVGDFSVVSRADGINQWAYKNNPLYTFDGDIAARDANGVGVDKRWRVAMLTRYFLPSQAHIQPTLSHGKVLATADGMTLYRRNSYLMQLFGRGFPHGISFVPAIGRTIGTKGCDAQCLNTWHPFLASADAKPSGYWQIAPRDDGARQWTYKGYALYTFTGDAKPGDVNGDELFDLFVNSDIHPVSGSSSSVASDVRSTNQAALFWSHAYP